VYVIIRRYETDPKSAGELVRRVREEFMPIIKKVPGFIGYTVIDGGDGTFASISTFQDKSGAEESTRRAAEWTKTIVGLSQSPPQITEGNIVVQSW